MCGIVGKLNHDAAAPVDPELLRRMADTIRHRGPDDDGVFTDGPVGLASRRLAIIDLSAQGHMPMSNEDGSLWIVFNGEIYNFQALREELIARGHRFRSRTDSEVVVHLYEAYGIDCVQRLRGMFAFAIWDRRTRALVLARDRLGKKPLFYAETAAGFVFASEPKAMLADPSVPREPDRVALHYYLTYQYVPSPYSAFRGFKKLPPAHTLVVRPGHAPALRRYWKLSYAHKVHRSERQLCEELCWRLREAVRIRMVSDVPLGAFLSGGLDSSAVVAMMSQLSTQPVKTFSIGFDEPGYNELPYARQVAQLFKTEHHEFVVRPKAVELLPALVWHYNEPYADSSALPTYYLSRLARTHVTVALNGDAGDENFAGYPRHVAIRLVQAFHRLPAGVRAGLAAAAGLIPASLPPRHPLRYARRFLSRLPETTPAREYGRWISHFTDAMKADLYAPAFHDEVGGIDSLGPLLDVFAASDAPDVVESALDADVNLYLPDDLLVKVDIASMAHSLEARSPLLDHELMEFVASIPARQKVRFGVKKYLFKRAMAGVLPREIIHREKQGFGVPIDRWFRGELADMAQDTLLSTRALSRGYFRRDAVARLLDEHRRGTAQWHHHLWNLLMLELWHQMFIDQPASPTSAPAAELPIGAAA